MSDVEFQAEVDLFGDPCRLPSGKRGRPAHRYAQVIADKIVLGLALGWSLQRIANGSNISIPTMKAYYSSILKRRDMQRDRLDLWRVEKLQQLGAEGNVAALKELGRVVERNDQMVTAKRMQNDDDVPAETKETLGKKELAKQQAEETVGDEAGWLKPGYGPN